MTAAVDPPGTARATGVGSMPGEDVVEAVRVVVGELGDPPGLLHLPELPARGAGAQMTGRAVAVCAELGFDLQPAGWRLTEAAPGLDQRRARSLLAQDLDALEEQTQGFTGELKMQVAGPWTLAATVERPRGDRLLADHGARRDVAQALAAGLADHLADVRRRVPGASLVLQLDEPALPAVLAAQVPTASGFGKHRSVEPPGASEALGWVLDAAGASSTGATTVVHCCAADVPVGLLRGAGAGAVSVDLGALEPGAYDDLATALDAGERVHLGLTPSSTRAVLDRVRRWLDMLGHDPAQVADRLVLTPPCGLAGATQQEAVGALRVLREAAGELSRDAG